MSRRAISFIFVFALLLCIAPIADRLEAQTSNFASRLKIGGEIRLRTEARQDFDFNDDVTSPEGDDRFTLSRIRLNLDFRPFEGVRLFTEIQDSRDYKTSIDRLSGPSAFEDHFDFFQLYADLKSPGDIPLTVRVGRQTLLFGEERLVGPFGWSNVGRSFQGVRLILEPEPIDLQVWWVNVVVPEDGELNEPDWEDDFFGVHATWTEVTQGQLDTYFFLRDWSDTGMRSYTLGGRFKGKPLADGSIDYDAEVAFQAGNFSSSLDQRAWALHAGAGHTLKGVKGSPRLGIQYNFATGDPDPTDSEHNTFDNLYPTNHFYYGTMDFMSWRNMHNLKLESSVKPWGKWLLQGDLHFFWLDEVEDAWYNAGGTLVRVPIVLTPLGEGPPTPVTPDTFLGQEIDLTARYTYNKQFQILTGYSHFFPGPFVEATGPADDANWFFLQTTMGF